MSLYRPTARNFMEDSENRMHSDDIAKQLGFDSALVAGVAVFGHVTHPFVVAARLCLTDITLYCKVYGRFDLERLGVSRANARSP